MAGLLIHDGRRIGHLGWCIEAVRARRADGIIVSPFSTPRLSIPRHPSAADLVGSVRDAGGEVIFDATTHARLLPECNRTDFYDGWDLWGSRQPALDSTASMVAHVETVFARQDSLRCPRLAPTVIVSSPHHDTASVALEMAGIARGLDSNCWQSLVGTRRFWASGADLDAYVGQLAALSAPTWVVTVANEVVLDHVPSMADIEAFSGLCRTIHSLSLRSRVIIAHADFAGLVAVASGADTVGTGWDRGQKTFDPNSFKLNSDPGIRIPASYVTQGQLMSVLRRDTADAIERWNAARARMIRGAAMPRSEQEQRFHHLQQLRSVVLEINESADRKDRVDVLRSRYEDAVNIYNELLSSVPGFVKATDRDSWAVKPLAVLRHYALNEGLWQ